MSGFEVAGLVFGVGLKFYEENTKNLRHHEEAMNDLIVSLHVEHCRFRKSCETILTGLAEDANLADLLEKTTEETWKKSLEGDLQANLEGKLGHRYHGYTETMAQLQRSLKQLGRVVGLEDNKVRSIIVQSLYPVADHIFNKLWYKKTKYRKLKWHAETWKKMSDCLSHDRHKRLLTEIGDCNNRLERLTPKISDSEDLLPPKLKKKDVDRLESVRKSAKSLYCALCSGWLCQCNGAHAAHFRLEDRMVPAQGYHRFSLSFKISTSQSDQNWQEADFEAVEEEEQEVPLASPRQPGRVGFVLAGSRSPKLSKHITDLCNGLQHSVNDLEVKCIGFIMEEERKHFVHLPKQRPVQPATRHEISLYRLLLNRGTLSSPVPLAIELLDKYEIALLLASSLLQLHTTSWLGELWSTEDIRFVPTKPNVALGDCAFLTKSFSPTVRDPQKVATTNSQYSARPLVIRNESVFRLGVTLVELSILATLQSQETDIDRDITELADFKTAKRISDQIQRNNVRQWNDVVDICLRCGFHAAPDFSKKDFRQEFYQWVVAPLQKLYDDAKPGS
ncbi:hypothetical protein Daus18300_000972 [Diaporthe australafricana]|uniref:DUF7580 domain-containing protein n=1 Tax=Diaporthe australafricana TaxID=127596 RepID=A0ABR3Y0V8_9PEZI